MFDLDDILQLYRNVLSEDIIKYCIKDHDVLDGITNMEGVYAQGFGPDKTVNFNSIWNRCAYLHKYAPLYTAIVSDIMFKILSDGTIMRFNHEFNTLRMCCLGGGPGTDAVGVLAALDAVLASSHWHTFVSIVDFMGGWQSTFESVLSEIKICNRLSFASRFTRDAFRWKFIEGDLLETRNNEFWDEVSCRSFVTAIKCLSTFRSDAVPSVIQKIFSTMSFGSFILIIDDSVEELTEIILRKAQENQLIPVFGHNSPYTFDELKVTKFGHTSCYQAPVTSLLLLKKAINPRSFVAPLFQAAALRSCEKCGQMYFCLKCAPNTPKSYSNKKSFDKNCSFCENELFKVPLNLMSTSPNTFRSLVSSQIEIPREHCANNRSISDDNNITNNSRSNSPFINSRSNSPFINSRSNSPSVDCSSNSSAINNSRANLSSIDSSSNSSSINNNANSFPSAVLQTHRQLHRLLYCSIQ